MKVVNAFGTPYSYKERYAGTYNHWLCGSCGARFQDNPDADLTRIHNGIKIIPGTSSKEQDNEVFSITHVKTRNGDLTVGIRKKVRK